MDEPETARCAVWYSGMYGHIDYELYDTEAEAADYAAYLCLNTDSDPLGVQFSDGRAVDIDDWAAYKKAYATAEAAAISRPPGWTPPPVRTVIDPFTESSVSVDLDAPGWLGRHEEERTDG